MFDDLKKYFDQIEKFVLSDEVIDGLDKVGDYCKSGAAILRQLKSGGISIMSAEDNATLDEIHNRAMELESKVRTKFVDSQMASVSATPTMDPGTMLFMFQTIVAVIRLIREARKAKG